VDETARCETQDRQGNHRFLHRAVVALEIRSQSLQLGIPEKSNQPGTFI